MDIIISLLPLSLADVTLRASDHWLGTRIGSASTRQISIKLSWPQPMAQWITGNWFDSESNKILPYTGNVSDVPR